MNSAKTLLQNCLLTSAEVMLFVVTGCLSISAQQLPSAVRPGAPIVGEGLSEMERMDPYSGALSFKLPLISAGGRGVNDSSISLNISQRWTPRDWYDRPENDDPRPYPYVVPEQLDNESLSDGVVQSGLATIVGVRVGSGSQWCYPGGDHYYYKTTTILTFKRPDGTNIELRDRNTNGAPATPSCGAYNRGTIFDAVDGTSATFVSDSNILEYALSTFQRNFAPTGYLYTADGTVYRIVDGAAQWSRDRNGNKISTTSEPLANTVTIADSLNREIKVEYMVYDVAPYGLCDRITYKGVGGMTRTIRVSYKNWDEVLRPGSAPLNGNQMFPDNFDIPSAYSSHYPEWKGDTPPADFLKPSAVWLPDGRSYKFLYNAYAELARVELPSGGAIEYEWGTNSGSGALDTYGAGGIFSRGLIYRRFLERRVYSDGVNLDNKLVVSGLEPLGNKQGYVLKDVFDSNNLRKARTKHYYFGILGQGEWPTYVQDGLYEPWVNGREYQTDNLDPATFNLFRRTNQEWYQTSPGWWVVAPASAPINKPQVIETRTQLADTNQMSKQVFGYDGNGNLTDTYDYDFGNGMPGSFIRRTHTDYLTTNPVNNINYTSDNVHILTLPSQTWVSSDLYGNNKAALTMYEYDNYVSDPAHTHEPLLDRANITSHDPNFGTSYQSRGNLTKVMKHADAQNQTGAVSTYSQFDIAGNVIKSIDAREKVATLLYADSFGSPDAEARTNNPPGSLNAFQTFAFATSATNALGTVYTQVDYYTGAVVDTEDVNGNVSTTFYNDALDRPTQTISANNRPSFRKRTITSYDDANRIVTITSDSKTFNDNLIKTKSLYDKVGRTIETRSYETATEFIASLVEYDDLGRKSKSSTPFRPHLNEQPAWTIHGFDELGRVASITTPDGATVSRTYSGDTTTVTDQANRKRSATSDAIGRVRKIVEDPNGLTYETNYVYDVLGRLRKATQAEGQTIQNRYFMYNDLGRLLRVKQTEQSANANLSVADQVTGNTDWSTSYSYDPNGNILTTTDASGRTVTETYDDLNRLTFRNYSDSTPDVTFTYDDSQVPNSKGQLTAITSSVSSTQFTAFDELGRIKSSRQTTNGTSYEFPDYSYDLSGALISETYPSGRVVSSETDDIGRLSKVTSTLPNQVVRTCLDNIGYASFGALRHARLGNGRWESAEFSSQRLQTTKITLGASANNSSLLRIDYSFGTTDNNGSLRQQVVTVPGASNPIVQNYTYDSLNRLQSAVETINSQIQWKQTFSIDRFGNRRFDAANTTTLPANDGINNPQVDLAKNRFTVAEGYNYDPDGNLISNPESQLFTYDAENRQVQVHNTATQNTANYFYDGSGKRVRKVFGNSETVFVYDAFGKLVAEYSNISDARPKAVSYLTTDELGTPRIVTDQLGRVTARHDYMPFGEEVLAGVGGRTTTQGYDGDDGVRQQFTAYERDDESGLDYAQARYFNPKHGRFTSVDPLNASATIKNPQTLNRYTYVLNSPYKFTDPLGMRPCSGARWDSWCDDSGDLGGGEIFRESLAKYEEMVGKTIEAARKEEEGERGEEPTGTAGAEGGGQPRIEGPFVVPAETLAKYGSESDSTFKELPAFGNGDCPLLAQNLVPNLGQVKFFIQGRALYEGSEADRAGPPLGHGYTKTDAIARGTVIFTPDDSGRYPKPDSNKHVAIFLSFGRRNGKDGIFVIDQFPNRQRNGKHTAGIRFIEERTGGYRSNNAFNFAVVLAIRPIRK